MNQKAKDHHCEPHGNSSIRAIHFILTAAFNRAVKWEYLDVNQPALAEPPEFFRACQTHQALKNSPP